MLPEGMLERISRLYNSLHDVIPLSLDELIDQFRRDRNPEKELKTWEAIALVYTAYTDRVRLTDDQRVRALRIILGTSVGMTVQGYPSTKLMQGDGIVLSNSTDRPVTWVCVVWHLSGGALDPSRMTPTIQQVRENWDELRHPIVLPGGSLGLHPGR